MLSDPLFVLFDEVEASVTAVTGCELVGAGVVVSGCAGCVAAAVAGAVVSAGTVLSASSGYRYITVVF